ncbi:MAG: DUF2220 family protein [Eubacteriales bacterium]
MDKFIKSEIENLNKKTFEISQMEIKVERKFRNYIHIGGYEYFFNIINSLVKEGHIVPVKSSGYNGRAKPLYKRYRRVDKKENLDYLKVDILSLHPLINNNRYINNLEKFNRDKEYIKDLDDYLKNKNNLKYRFTANERSYEIFNDEKFLLSKRGENILRYLNIELEDLNCYKTDESFFYILEKKDKTTALIIENKDTYTTLYKLFIEKEGLDLFNYKINLLIYGEGKKIINSFKYVEDIVETNSIEIVLYFGDIDPEGLRIYEKLYEKYLNYSIIPFEEMYDLLIEKSKDLKKIKNSQRSYLENIFTKKLSNKTGDKIMDIVLNKKYIPQEALNSLILNNLIRQGKDE